jgi:hypothetical protein
MSSGWVLVGLKDTPMSASCRCCAKRQLDKSKILALHQVARGLPHHNQCGDFEQGYMVWTRRTLSRKRRRAPQLACGKDTGTAAIYLL